MISEVPEEKGSPPEFIKVPHQVVAREHDCAQFLVKVVGVPKPTGKDFLYPLAMCMLYLHYSAESLMNDQPYERLRPHLA